MPVIVTKAKEVLYSVLPITALVVLLHFTWSPLEVPMLLRFFIGAALVTAGLTIFLLGVDIGVTPIGSALGASIAKSGRVWVVALAGILLGFFISIAEPDLHILAAQVNQVTAGAVSKNGIVIMVSLGIAALLALGLIRIVYNLPLNKVLTFLYGGIFAMALFSSPEFLAISFDASGATTGALTVPFILALALGVSHLKKDSKASEEDSFGLVAIASTGAIMAVMVMHLVSGRSGLSGPAPATAPPSESILGPFAEKLPFIALESAVALAPILLVFLLFHKLSLKLPQKNVRRILFGMLLTLVGLVLFLLGVHAGFMEVGHAVGYRLAAKDTSFYVILVGFVLGLLTILAEPAVYILTRQIEDVTSGFVSRKAVMVSLALGVALAVALSILRILVPGIQLWHYLLPGYLLSVALSYIVPKLFVGIAFDSGGVASGPMTATFILAFAQGAAEATAGANVLVDGFGIIAMVAMTPLLALQLLGLVFQRKMKKSGVDKNA